MTSNVSSFSTSFSKRDQTQDEDPFVILEQEETDSTGGKVTFAKAMRRVGNTILSYLTNTTPFGNPEVDCGLDDEGCFQTTVFAFPSSRNLSFTYLELTNGEVLDRSIKEDTYSEYLQFNNTETQEFSYPCLGVLSVDFPTTIWEGNKKVTSPSFTYNSSGLSFSSAVSTTIKVTYQRFFYVFKVKVPPLVEEGEDVFRCVAYTYFRGGVSWVDLKEPYRASDTFILGGKCDSLQVVSDGSSEGQLPTAPKKDKKAKYDYCSNELKSESYQ